MPNERFVYIQYIPKVRFVYIQYIPKERFVYIQYIPKERFVYIQYIPKERFVYIQYIPKERFDLPRALNTNQSTKSILSLRFPSSYTHPPPPLDRPRFNFYAHDLLFVHEFSS
jgi:hypothetical protein